MDTKIICIYIKQPYNNNNKAHKTLHRSGCPIVDGKDQEERKKEDADGQNDIGQMSFYDIYPIYKTYRTSDG